MKGLEMSKPTAKAKICDALLRMLPHHDADDILVKELVAEAGVNRTSFYYHFHSVTDVLDTIVDELSEGVYSSVLPFPDPGEMTSSELARSRWLLQVRYMYDQRAAISTLIRCGYRHNIHDSLRAVIGRNFDAIVYNYHTIDGREKTLSPGPLYDYFIFKTAAEILTTMEYLVRRNFLDSPEEMADLLFEANTLEWGTYSKAQQGRRRKAK